MWQRTILLTIIAFVFCWMPLFAEEIHRKDTTILAGKYQLFFRSVTDDTEVEELNEEYFNNRSNTPVFINDLDSVLTLLGDEVKLQYHYYPDNETPFISSITCRNGMKVLFVEFQGFSGYDPEKDIIVLQESYYLITGEQEVNLKHIIYDKTNNIRIRYHSYYSYSHEIILEKYEPSAKEFISLINFKRLFGPDTMVAPLLRKDNRLFIRIGTSWSELTLKAAKKM